MNKRTSQANIQNLSIVIPVFNALKETVDCVEALLKSDAAHCPIILMDDASGWNVQETLRETFAEYSNISIVSHFRNRGYTRNISMGVQQTHTPYVCILNSDTLVPSQWAQTLVNKLHFEPHIAGAGPLSNAGSYQSVPEVIDLEDGRFSENNGLGFDQSERNYVANLVNLIAKNISVDVPILNGFCTIFRRDAIEKIGGFDVDSYPEGYGEENDLCIRLRAKGYRLHVCLDVFVHHQKSKSFGSQRKKILSDKGAKTLARKFGPTLIPSLSKQLETNTSLQTMRAQLKEFLDLESQALSISTTLTAASGPLKLDQRSPKTEIVTLKGPGRFEIDHANIYPNDTTTLTKNVVLETEKNGIAIELPENCQLTLEKGKPIATAMFALGLLSIENMVHVRRWEPITNADNSKDMYQSWPKTWGLPSEVESLEFVHLYLKNDTLLNEVV